MTTTDISRDFQQLLKAVHVILNGSITQFHHSKKEQLLTNTLFCNMITEYVFLLWLECAFE